jgi:vitamin B12 transporter
MHKLVVLFIAGILISAGAAQAALPTLDQVVVTATRTAQPRSEVAASVAVVTADEIAARGATRLDDVLQDVIGLHLVSTGSTGSLTTPSIRGSESPQVLVLIDGMRLNSAQNGLTDLSSLPVALSDIERIEVLRGPASALYGSNAVGGVIQIFTKQPDATPQTRVSWSEGRADSRRLGITTSRQLDGYRYRLGLEKQQSQGYRDNSDYDQYSINTLLGVALPHQYDLELNAFHFDRENGAPGPTSFPSLTARQSDRNTLASLALRGPVGPVEVSLTGSYERHVNRFREPSGFFAADDTHKLNTYGLELQGTIEQGRHTLVIGSDYSLDDLDSTANGNRDQERGALFAQYQLDATDMLQLLFGLRYDVHSDFRNELSPRASLLLKLTDATRLRASASKAFRAPTLNDRFWPDDGFSVGNPDLVPETAWEYELALEQQLGTVGSGSLAGFLRDADDLINWAPADPTDPFSIWSPFNVSNARIWGAEAGVDLRLCDYFASGANYTWLYAKDRDTDAYLAGKPRHQLHGYLAVGPFKDLTLRLDGRYAAYYPADTSRKGFVVFDASLNRPFVIGQVDFEATLAVKNLFDRAYEINPGYPMPPQEFQLAMTAYF